jgi:photosystem II stability/assembly factor-like uncharacterized protein
MQRSLSAGSFALFEHATYNPGAALRSLPCPAILGMKPTMFMQQFKSVAGVLCAAVLVAACTHAGNSVDPPTGFAVTAGDNRVTVTWDTVPGVDYWLFYGPGDGVSPANWTNALGSLDIMHATSPQVVAGLLNDATYSFSADARTNGGPGGAPTASVSKKPRLAGAEWKANTPISSAPTLRGVTTNGSTYLAAGVDTAGDGVIYSSTDAQNWTANYTATGHPLNGIYNAIGVYLAVGDAGKVFRSTDLVTWTDESATTGNVPSVENLNAVASNFANLFVAVGNNGTILHSADGGVTWNPPTTVTWTTTAQNLYGVTYAVYGTTTMWLAVGSGGTILKSTDGAVTWSQVHSGGADLKSIAYGPCVTTLAGVTTYTSYPSGACLVAVGNTGTALTADPSITDPLTSIPSLATWDARTLPGVGTSNINAVMRGSQFVAVGDSGYIATSQDGATWTQATSWLTSAVPRVVGGTQPTDSLYAITHAAYDYAAVGGNGVNLYAQ